MDYISAYAEDFLRVAGVRCRMNLPLALPAMRVDAELRYNLFLALKEALNNVVKHAKATEVWLRLKIETDSFKFRVRSAEFPTRHSALHTPKAGSPPGRA